MQDTIVKAFRFGLLAPTLNRQLVFEQIKLAHRYYNDLIMIERGKRNAIRALLSQFDDLRVLEHECKQKLGRVLELQQAINRKRAATRTRKADDPLQLAELKTMKAELRGMRKAIFDRRSELRADSKVKAEISRISTVEHELSKNARAHSGLRHGTYILIEAAVEQAAKTTPMYDGVEPQNPRYRSWDYEGTIGVQIPGGCVLSQLFGNSTMVQIDQPDPQAFDHHNRGTRRRHMRTKFRIRVGSNPDRSPIWAEFPMVMHRPLPPGSLIKVATVHLRKQGVANEWSVVLTAQMPKPQPRHVPHEAVAIDLGWRVFDDRIRVCTWHGSDGRKGELVLDAEQIGRLRKAAELASIRDLRFDAIKLELQNWVEKNLAILPPWFQRAVQWLPRWKSIPRFASFVRFWERNRFRGDEQIFGESKRDGTGVAGWRYLDYHHWNWQAHTRTRSIRMRRELFRLLGAELARTYRTLVLERFDLNDVLRREVIAGDPQTVRANANRHLSSPGDLRTCLINAFGADVEFVDPFKSTKECSSCHHINEFDAAANIRFTCSSCNANLDQDESAAEVLLGRRSNQPREMVIPPKEPVEKKWVRVRRMRDEKVTRVSAPS